VTKEAENKALATAEGGAENASLASFLGKFDMSIPFTPENVQLATERIQIVGRMHAAISEICVVDHGKVFIWFKAGMTHGEWEKHLKDHFSMIPARTIRWWMAEARYFMEYGSRKTAICRFAGQDVAGFGDQDGDELDADDLADPHKPAPKPRSELEYRIGQLEKRLDADKKREEKLLNERDYLARRLQAEESKRDPDAMDEVNCPIKTTLLAGLLATGRAREMIKEAVAEGGEGVDIGADCPITVLTSVASQLNANAQTISDFVRPMAVAFAKKHNAKKAR